MSSSTSNNSNPPAGKFPMREIPGNYGYPFIGPIKDRYDYFYRQGQVEFFKSRIQKYNSTVFRTNMPPGPFISSDSRVVAVLDTVSFPILFNTNKVEKKDILDGTFMPSLSFFGGYRTCAFLDPSESKHHTLKSLYLSLLADSHKTFIPKFRSNLSELFIALEDEVSDKKKANFNTHSDNTAFDFVFSLFSDFHRPSDTHLGSSGPGRVTRWLALQLAPLGSAGSKLIPSFIEDFVHTVRIPAFLVKPDYNKLYDAFYASAGGFLDKAEKLGIPRDEACHNLVFLAGFNAFGGMKVLFPTLIKWVALSGESLHQRLADEIRTVVKSEGGVSFSALEKMALTKSVVYEVLRIEPPVPFQYAKAKEDIVVDSHDSSYLIKKGETIFGYQPLVTKDAKVFENPDEFVSDRFVGDGEKLIEYVYWSNGRETEDPTTDNKQCPAKDLIVLLSRLILVEFFLRYDTFTADIGPNVGFGPSVKIKSLTKAT